MLKTNLFEDAETRKCHVYDPSDCNEFMRHDAAYSHALVMAVNELGEASNYWTDGGRTSDQKSWIFGRADELMAEWGYPNTEYPQDIGMASKGGSDGRA